MMKLGPFIALVFALAGCSIGKQHHAMLTPQQASDLALHLANEKAQSQYQVEPFRAGPAAQFVQGRWVWHQRKGLGQTDMEATVKFAPDGSNPSVSVLLLDSRSEFPRESPKIK